MNNKQLLPLIAKMGLFGGIVWVLYSLSSENEAKKTPEPAPVNTETENRRKEAETALKTPVFRPIQPEIPVRSAMIPPLSFPPAPKIPIPAPPATIPAKNSAAQIPLTQIKRKFVTREDIAAIFHHGARPLTRPAAVAALKGLGFGQTAAYEALLENGRFATWLQFAPDGIITWNT